MSPNRLRNEARRLIAGGADPRRAEPDVASRFGLPPAVFRNKVFAQGFLACTLLAAAGGAIGAAAFGARPAKLDDLRLASVIRSVLPNADELPQDELVARLSMSAKAAQTLAPVVAFDPARRAIQGDWFALLVGNTPLAISPGRMDALSGLLTRLASLAPADRVAALDVMMESYRALQDRDAAQTLKAMATITRTDAKRLVETGDLADILSALARAPEDRRREVIGVLQLPADPDIDRVLRLLHNITPLAVRTLNKWVVTDGGRRAALDYVADRLDVDDPMLGRLLSAFVVGNRGIMTALAALPAQCRFLNPEPCR